jgi:outer membrane protein, heavy metal efflux system
MAIPFADKGWVAAVALCMHMITNRWLKLISLAGWVAALPACTSIPAQRGSDTSQSLLESRSAVAAQADVFNNLKADEAKHRQALQELTSQPLDADASVRVALLGNARIAQLYAQLGVAQADVYDASRLSNPSIGFIALNSDAGVRRTWTLTQNFTELLFLHYRTRVSQSQLLQAQQSVAQAVLDLEHEVRVAYYRYVVSRLQQQLQEQNVVAAQASSDYAQALYTAGNISELQLSREQAALSEARIAAGEAGKMATAQRGALLTLLGLPLEQANIEFVERLDVPVAQTLETQSLQRFAEAQRVDLQALNERLTQLNAERVHARRWSWLDKVEVDAERERETDGTRLSGVGGSVGLPLFNQGGGQRLRTQAAYENASAELSAMKLQIHNDIAVQVASLNQARAVVEEYRNQLTPLRERIVTLSQQQQNFMLIGAFEVLQSRREALRAYQDYLSATGDFWIALASLGKTLGGRLPDSAGDASYGISVGVEPLP